MIREWWLHRKRKSLRSRSGYQTYLLRVSQVPESARGGALFFGASGNEVQPLTAALRQGTTAFMFSFGSETGGGGGGGGGSTSTRNQSSAEQSNAGGQGQSALATQLSLSTRSDAPTAQSLLPFVTRSGEAEVLAGQGGTTALPSAGWVGSLTQAVGGAGDAPADAERRVPAWLRPGGLGNLLASLCPLCPHPV